MPVKWIALAIVCVMYATIIIVPQKKAFISLAAAVIVVLLGIIGPVQALTEHINWNILMIYVGSLVIADLFIYSRAPARIADNIVNMAPNAGIAIVVIIVITGLISAFVENVATVLVMAPIALALSKKLNMKPDLFMVGLAVMANLQGTATLVGDPPSMIFASFADYGFNDFFFYEGRLSIFFVVQTGMLAGALFFYIVFSKIGKRKVFVEKEKVLSLVPSALLVLMVASLALCSFILNSGVTLTAGLLVAGLGIAGILWYAFVRKESGAAVKKLLLGLDWETIFFLIGIFVVVGALSDTGLLADFAGYLNGVIGGNLLAGFVIVIIVSIIISGFVDNVPYIIAMLPVVKTLSVSMNIQPELYMFALLVGSCLGGNLTPFGASANIVAIGILKKEGINLNFQRWLKTGIPFTFITTTAAALLLWFVWT
ncbi:MAG: anion permease [Spirochaetaceae bacterium]|jgi:Na+/H+ antiporter NhaD/arsenite permease-like protein|nr:anion permease [Spirochaetaceae bacterium]